MYLSMASFFGVVGIKYKHLKKKNIIIPALMFILCYGFCFWGVSSLFHTIEGYPPTWFFYLTSTPVWIVSFWALINVKK